MVEEGEGVGGRELRGGKNLRGLVGIFLCIRPHGTGQLQPDEKTGKTLNMNLSVKCQTRL